MSYMDREPLISAELLPPPEPQRLGRATRLVCAIGTAGALWAMLLAVFTVA